MVKSSIVKTLFKKWLKSTCNTMDVYYLENAYIGSESVMINLGLIDNLDDLKPAIVEVFGHLEGAWVHHVDGEVDDVHENEIYNVDIILDMADPITPDDKMTEITHSGFRTKRGMQLYDDLTMIPDSLSFIDYHRTFMDGRCVFMTTMSDDRAEIIMLIDSTLKLTGKDIDIDFVNNLLDAYKESVKEDE